MKRHSPAELDVLQSLLRFACISTSLASSIALIFPQCDVFRFVVRVIVSEGRTLDSEL